MALDTRDKRASAIGVAGGSSRLLLPNPDAPAEDQGDRQQLAYTFRGILSLAEALAANGNFKILPYNLINDPNVVLSASSETLGFPVTNLRDERLSRKYKATGKTSEWVKLNCSSVIAAYKSFTDFAITVTNLTINAVVRVQCDTTDNFASPPINQAKALTLDPDTDPSTWGETQIESIPYKTHYFRLTSDVLTGNNWIRIVIEDPDNSAPIRIAKMYIGWGLEWTVNYNLGWAQGFGSHGSVMRSSSGGFFQSSRATFDTIDVNWSMSPAADHVKAKYIAQDFGNAKSIWVCLEPDHTTVAHATDGVRAHGLTFYGYGSMTPFTEPITGVLRYGFQFREAVTVPFRETITSIPAAAVWPMADLAASFGGGAVGQAVTAGATGETLTLFDTLYDPNGWSDGAVGAGVNTASSITPDLGLEEATIIAGAFSQIKATEYDAELIIEVNGTEVARQSRTSNITGITQYGASFNFSKTMPLVANDVVTLRFKHNFGSDVFVNAAQLQVYREIAF